MKNVGYYNGEIAPLEELKIPALDRAFYFGDGIYEAALFHNGVIFTLKEHLERFYNSLRFVEIDFPLSAEEVTAELLKVVKACDSDTGMLYWQVSRGTAPRDHAFPKGAKPNLFAYAVPKAFTKSDRVIQLKSVEDTRFFHCNVKTLNLIVNCISYQHGLDAGCQEIVFHRGERVTEAAHSNVLILKDGKLICPPLDNLILPGVTMRVLKELAPTVGIPVEVRVFTMDELKAADEVLISSSTQGGVRVSSVDGAPVGMKDPETFGKLRDAYFERWMRETEA